MAAVPKWHSEKVGVAREIYLRSKKCNVWRSSPPCPLPEHDTQQARPASLSPVGKGRLRPVSTSGLSPCAVMLDVSLHFDVPQAPMVVQGRRRIHSVERSLVLDSGSWICVL